MYDKHKLNEMPLTGWRLLIKTRLVCPFCKAIVFCCGFHRIKVNGKRADKDVCRILVAAPHTSFMDGLLGFILEHPIAVTTYIPIYDYLCRAVQSIVVMRRKAGHDKLKVGTIIARSDPQTTWPQILIYPEGTTSNGSCLISFKAGKLHLRLILCILRKLLFDCYFIQIGAFLPARPVQSIIIKYGKPFEGSTWNRPFWSFMKHAFLTLARFNNKMELTVKNYVKLGLST